MCWLSTAARPYYRNLTDAFHTISSGIPPNYVSSAWREHHFASQGPILIWFLGCLGCLCLCFPARRPPLCGSPVGDIVNGGEWNPWLSGRPLSHDTGVACCCSEYSSSDWVGLRDIERPNISKYTQITELLSILSIGFPRQRPLCFSLLVAMGILRFCPGDFAAAWHDPTQGFQACFLEAQDQQVRVIVVGSWTFSLLVLLDVERRWNFASWSYPNCIILCSRAWFLWIARQSYTRCHSYALFALHPIRPIHQKTKVSFIGGKEISCHFNVSPWVSVFSGWLNWMDLNLQLVISPAGLSVDVLPPFPDLLPLSSVAEVRCGDALLWDLAVVITRCAASPTSGHHGTSCDIEASNWDVSHVLTSQGFTVPPDQHSTAAS